MEFKCKAVALIRIHGGEIKEAVLMELNAVGLSTLVGFMMLKSAALVELIAVGLKAHGRRAQGWGAG